MISSSSSAIKITLFDYTAICYTNFYDEQNQQGQLNEIDIKWLTSQPQKPQKIRRLKLYQMYKIQIARNGVFQVALDNRLPNQKQLEQIFLNNYKQYKNDGGSYELDEVQLQNAILFDYFQYIRTCEYIYKDKQIEKNIKTKNPKILLKYLKEMKEYYVKQKIKTLLKYFEQQKFDILFMEKALPLSQQMLKQLLQNRLLYFEKKNDVVLIKKQNFNKNLLVFKKSYFSQFISLISQLNNDYQIISLKIKLLKTRQNKILYNRSKQQFFKQSYVVEVGQQSYKKQVQKIEQVQQEFFTQTNGDLKCYEQTFKLVKK